ncbi:MAG: tetratricopeptide repeat protein, partial [Acutalibacteraceae bacterium]|nr:tetratricopeptide repeat protein [Acutalibacteraceae bacterium]
REVLEETGIEVKVDRLAVVLENFFKGVGGPIDGLDCHAVEFYYLVNDEKYADYDFKNKEQYEEFMTAIGSIIDKQITVVSIDKKTSQLVPSSEAMVRFCQYMFAYSNGYYEDSYQYMNRVYELEPSYLWLYAYELGMAELQSGNRDKAQVLADALYNSNVELADAYALQSSIARMSGNNKKAIKWAEDGIKNGSDNIELYRIKAMAYVADGDYEKAKEAIDTALESDKYGLLCMTAIVVENELDNKDRVKELKDIMKDNDMEISEKTKKYLKGEISAQEMFTEGTGDVE